MDPQAIDTIHFGHTGKFFRECKNLRAPCALLILETDLLFLYQKVQEMYFANPPVEPNVETYKEVMAVLIKYDDR